MKFFLLIFPLLEIKPLVQSQWLPIIKGWIFSVAYVFCFSAFISRLVRLPPLLARPISNKIVGEGLMLASLACAFSVTSRWSNRRRRWWQASHRPVWSRTRWPPARWPPAQCPEPSNRSRYRQVGFGLIDGRDRNPDSIVIAGPLGVIPTRLHPTAHD